MKLNFKTLPRPTTKFHWPTPADKCTLPAKDILGVLREAPTPANYHTSQFCIFNNTMDAVDAKFAKFLSFKISKV